MNDDIRTLGGSIMSKREEIKQRRLKVLELYKKGLEIKKIAEYFFCSEMTIYNDLKALREEAPETLSRRPKKRRAEVLKLYQAGLTLTEIAQKLSCARKTVVYDLKTLREEDWGIPSRRHCCTKAELKERRAEVLRLHKEGLRIKDIAKELSFNYSTILGDLNILERAGKLKRRTKKPSKSTIEKRRTKILALYNEGFIPEEIAERLRCNVRTVYNDLRALGL